MHLFFDSFSPFIKPEQLFLLRIISNFIHQIFCYCPY